MRASFVAFTVAAVALTACGETEPAGGARAPTTVVTTAPPTADPATTDPSDVVGSNGPFDPDATLRPDLMIVEPSIVAPGEDVTVTYPGGRDRGVAYVLEQLGGGAWHTTHFMTAATDRYGIEPSWVAYGAPGYGWEDIGISGPGPDALVIPSPALAGDHRICTANSVEDICAEVTIVSSQAAGPFDAGTSEPVADLLGLPLAEFTQRAVERGFGPVRVGWRAGEFLPLTQDLEPGRVFVATERRDGVDIVIDARVEADTETETGTLGPEATIVDVFEGVEFYPACGNEQLEHAGVVWYQVQQGEHPQAYARAAEGYRENIPEEVAVPGFAPHGFAARVAPPGPGDDFGTLVVWSDAVAYFASDSGELTAWLVREELTYPWEC